ncbi:MAG: lipoprotein-releasing ABC transporter permease subunit [Beijerinckiaceae bacterium]|nr:lipoprotein-releasing ABC transporter permease subunit [Beijerinckiaceae bacterium]
MEISKNTGPFAPFEWMIALRYLRARRKTSFVSVIALFSFLGIMLGVATLIVVMSVMNGFHKELLDKILGINGHIFLQAADSQFTDYEEVVREAGAVPGIELAVPMIESPAAASTSSMAFALVRGMKEADIKRLPGVANNIKLGTLDGFDTAGGVAIGQRLAENLGLRIGDKLKILTAQGAQTPFGVTPRSKVYPVSAIFQIGMSEFDNLFVYMALPEAQGFFNKDNQASVIEIFVARPEELDAIKENIGRAVMRPMIMTDWRERNKTYFDALNVERNVMFIILTMIVLVAALNIISGLIMLVKDKGQDIAILRTMGATQGGIMRIFLITGASIGVAGTLAGCSLGLILATNVEPLRQVLNRLLNANLFPPELYFLSRLPSVVYAGDVVAVAAMTLVLSVLATLYPSWSASKLDPVEALRYE